MDELSNIKTLPIQGKTLTAIDGAERESESVTFVCDDGTAWRMFHKFVCCENVRIEDVCGDISDLIGVTLVLAEEVSQSYCQYNDTGDDASCTWTFYTFRTIKGSVTLRWLGESNGEYSESVDFEEVTQ